jgi:zinc transporter ZupT
MAKGVGVMAISEVILHSLLEGVVIALGFDIDVGVGIVVSIAVIGHDLSDGVSAMTVMLWLGQSTDLPKRCCCWTRWLPPLRSWSLSWSWSRMS